VQPQLAGLTCSPAGIPPARRPRTQSLAQQGTGHASAWLQMILGLAYFPEPRNFHQNNFICKINSWQHHAWVTVPEHPLKTNLKEKNELLSPRPLACCSYSHYDLPSSALIPCVYVKPKLMLT